VTNVLKAGLQSSTIMTVADIATQMLVEGKSSADLDAQRTLRFTVAGLALHGPYFFVGFSALDRQFGAPTSFKVVAQKTAAAQFILFPPYLAMLFGLMGTLEQHPNVAEKIRTKVPEAFMSGCIYWPVANSINFALIPTTFRVPYLAVSAGLWNCYLSWENAKDDSSAGSKKKTT